MALSLGELVGFIDLQDQGFARGLGEAERGLSSLQSATTGAMANVESTVASAMANVSDRIADGVAPERAMSEIDRLVAEFRSAIDQMEAQARAGGRGIADELARGMESAQSSARSAGSGAGRSFSEGVEDGGRARMPGAGNALIGVIKSLGWASAGAAAGAALVSGLTSALDAEQAKAKLNAQLGTTPEESARIGRVAGKMYADAYGESMGDVTNAIRAVVQNMDGMRAASEADLERIAKRAMDVSSIVGEDVQKVTGAVSQMLRTGMAQSAEEAFDIVVKATQNGINKSEDLIDTINEYSTHFRSLGLTGEQALGLIQQALQAGARDSDYAADAIKEFQINAVAGSDKVVKALKEMGLNADELVKKIAEGGPGAAKAFDTILDKLREIKDPVERNALAVELFGTKAEDLADALFAMDLDTATKQFGEFGGAAQSASDQLHQTAANRLEAFKRTVQQNVVDFLGGTVIPAIQNFAQKFDLGGLAQKAGQVFDQVKSTVGRFLEPLKSAFESFREFASAFWDQFGDEIMSILSTVGQTIAGVWEGIWNTIKGIFDVFAGILTGDWQRVWDGLKSIVSGVWQAITSLISGAVNAVKTVIGGAWDAIKSLTSSAWNAVKDAVVSKANEVVTWVKSLPGKIKNALGNLGTLLVSAGRDLINGLINGIKGMVSKAVDAVKNVASNVVSAAKKALGIESPSTVFAEIGKWTVEGFAKGISTTQEKAKTAVTNLVNLIKKGFQAPGIADPLRKWAEGETEKLAQLLKKREEILEAMANAKKYAQEIAQAAKEFASITSIELEEGATAGNLIAGLQERLNALKQFANDIKTLAQRGLNKEILRQIIEAGPEKGLSLAEMLVGASGSEIKAINKLQAQIDKVAKQVGKNSADALYDSGKKAAQGFLKGLQAQAKEIERVMVNIAKKAVAALKKELGIKSPSRVFQEAGTDSMEGLALGVLQSSSAVMQAVTQVAQQMVAVAKAATAGVAAATSTGGMPGLIPPAAPAGATATSVGGGPVVVQIDSAVVREEADLGRIGAEFGFQLRARG